MAIRSASTLLLEVPEKDSLARGTDSFTHMTLSQKYFGFLFFCFCVRDLGVNAKDLYLKILSFYKAMSPHTSFLPARNFNLSNIVVEGLLGWDVYACVWEEFIFKFPLSGWRSLW